MRAAVRADPTDAAPVGGPPTRPPLAPPAGPPGLGATPPTAWPLPRLAHPPSGPTPPSMSALRTLLVGLLGAALVGLIFAGYVLGHDRTTKSAASTTTAVARSGAIDVHRILSVAQPSVVTIQTGVKNSIFGAAGSGVIISRDGLILTNDHVIKDANRIEVQFDDGTRATAQGIGASPASDIAVLRTDRRDLVPATLGSSDALQVGDDVVAIGNALNLGGSPSVTRGIVSAKERSIPTRTGARLDHLIQTDAAINPGNSGGPLVNAQGEVVGINTAIIADAQNIGFSIAIDAIKPLLNQLESGRGPTSSPIVPDLGADLVDVGDPGLPQSVRDRFGVTAPQGAFVLGVSGGSAGANAGLQQGDVITEIDGRPMLTAADVRRAVAAHAAGDTVLVTVERQGRRLTLPARLPR